MESFSDYVVLLDAIRSNLLEYKKQDKTSKICAVVKGDGYGLGAKNVIASVDDLVDFYAVACLREAAKLVGKTTKNILVLNYVPKSALKFCADNNIAVTIYSLCHIKQILSLHLDEPIKVHIAINTGMNRIGFGNLNDFYKAVLELNKNRNKIVVEGVYTHIYNANNEGDTKKQMRMFMQFLNVLSLYFDLSKIVKHTTSSCASIKYPQFRFDMVRLGILLCGGLERSIIPQKATLKIESKIVDITNVKKGESVGYDKKFIANKNMTVATIPVGYADGIFRSYSKNGYVYINGRRCKIVGNICMDMLMVDITNVYAKTFDKVEILGDNITLNEVAKNCNTISYEILTNIKQNRFNVKVKK